MPFGSKNAGATYQSLINKVFKDQIDHNMEVYIDNMLIKSQQVGHHVVDLKETFQIFRKYFMKLNLAKYAFRVSFEKFFDFIILHR